MKKLITVALFALSLTAFSQHEIGIRAGISGSQITGPTGEGVFSNYLNVNYGYSIAKNWKVLTGFEYERKGDSHTTIYTYNNLPYRSESEVELNYYSIPLTIGYYSDSRLFGSVQAGFIGRYMSFGYSSSSNYQNNELSASHSTEAKDNFKEFDLGVVLELGGGFRITEQHAISLTARFDHGFRNIFTQLPNGASAKRNRGVLIALGYTLTL